MFSKTRTTTGTNESLLNEIIIWSAHFILLLLIVDKNSSCSYVSLFL